MVPELSIDQFSETFIDLPVGEVVGVDIGGSTPLPVKVSPSPGARALVVVFHGAANRDKRPYPTFLNFRDGVEGAAHQISVTDATLGLDDKLAIGWYAGAPGLLLQKLLPPFFEKLKAALEVDRLIFMGSSGGGYAALFYSWHFPGSVAVVQVPQTNVWDYHLPGALKRYQATCWPDGLASYPEAPILDLRDLYKDSSLNSIVYIQSTLDTHHLHDQMLPFLGSMPADMRDRIVVKSSFWGRSGHSNVVPMREWDGWLRAALTADHVDGESIVRAYQELGIEKTPQVGKQNAPTDPKNSPNSAHAGARRAIEDQDLIWAKLVVDSQSPTQN